MPNKRVYSPTTGLSGLEEGKDIPIARRALEWPLFCELNNIGDLNHDVQFERVIQFKDIVDCLRNFVDEPQGLILMKGPTGTGKTYAALAACEFFTRTSKSCMFVTHMTLFKRWVKASMRDEFLLELEKIKNVDLLVIDTIVDISRWEEYEEFLLFMLNLLEFRTDSEGKGTILTSWLTDYELEAIFGKKFIVSALNQTILNFEGKSRRKRGQIL